MCIRGSFSRVKRLAREADHSLSFSAKDNNECIFSSTPPTCHYDMYRAGFALVLDVKVAVDSKDSKDSLGVSGVLCNCCIARRVLQKYENVHAQNYCNLQVLTSSKR